MAVGSDYVGRTKKVGSHLDPPLPLTSIAMASTAAPELMFNADGSVQDPAAFRAFIRQDPARLEAIQDDPEVAASVLGDDDVALQELLRGLFKVMMAMTTLLSEASC